MISINSQTPSVMSSTKKNYKKWEFGVRLWKYKGWGNFAFKLSQFGNNKVFIYDSTISVQDSDSLLKNI